MFKLYYASAIDTCVEEAFKQIEEFKKLFCKYSLNIYNRDSIVFVKNPIEIYGAGFNESPIITPDTSPVYKGAVSAYDLRVLRGCDILLVVTDLKQFAVGTMMELEYARNLGIYTIILALPKVRDCFCKHPDLDECVSYAEANHCAEDKITDEGCKCGSNRMKNIFLETYANKIIYSMSGLEEILKDLTQ